MSCTSNSSEPSVSAMLDEAFPEERTSTRAQAMAHTGTPSSSARARQPETSLRLHPRLKASMEARKSVARGPMERQDSVDLRVADIEKARLGNSKDAFLVRAAPAFNILHRAAQSSGVTRAPLLATSSPLPSR